MRVSEFCGLTKKDLDFKNRIICVAHQLVRERGGKYYVEETKTSCGCHYLPMTDNVYHALKNMLARRLKVKKEVIVDGYSNFIMLDKNGKPKVALHIENETRWAMKKYKKLHSDNLLPHITPRVWDRASYNFLCGANIEKVVYTTHVALPFCVAKQVYGQW